MWNTLSKPWKECFNQAWLSYCNGSFPIGAVIVDESGNIISKGRNTVYEMEALPNEICNNKIAHAEINAILKINNLETNASRKEYELYSTMEPCPLCFGAIVMSGITNIHYAARDKVVGATNLKDANTYLQGKNMKVSGPYKELEIVQFVLKTDFVLRRGHAVDRLLQTWEQDCPVGITIGRKWYELNKLVQAKQEKTDISIIIDEIISEVEVLKKEVEEKNGCKF